MYSFPRNQAVLSNADEIFNLGDVQQRNNKIKIFLSQ